MAVSFKNPRLDSARGWFHTFRAQLAERLREIQYDIAEPEPAPSRERPRRFDRVAAATEAGRQADLQTGRQADLQAGRPAGLQTGRRVGRHLAPEPARPAGTGMHEAVAIAHAYIDYFNANDEGSFWRLFARHARQEAMGVTLRGADQIVDNTWIWRREYPEVRGHIANVVYNDGQVGIEVVWSESGRDRRGHAPSVTEYIHLTVGEGLITRVTAQPDRASWLRFSRGSAVPA